MQAAVPVGSGSDYLAEVLAGIKSEVHSLKTQKVRIISAPVTATNIGGSTFSVTMPTQEDGSSTAISGIPAPSQFLPSVGDTVDLQVIDAVPYYQPAGLAINAVGDPEIANVSASKIVAGVISANVTLSGRIATSLTGQRTELNSTGLTQYDGSGNLLVQLGAGTVLLTGVYKTALSGRRIEVGAGGNLGRIDFYAPDGTNTAYVHAYTESSGVEAMQYGVTIPSSDALWNRINYNSDQWSNYRAKRHDFTMFNPLDATFGGFFYVRSTTSVSNNGTGLITRLALDTTTSMRDAANKERLYFDGTTLLISDSTRARIAIDNASSGTSFYDYNGALRFQIGPDMYVWSPLGTPRVTCQFVANGDLFLWPSSASSNRMFQFTGEGTTGDSGRLFMTNAANFGVCFKMFYPGSGTLRYEMRNVLDTGFEAVFASAFTVSSDQRFKHSIRGLEPGEDMLGSVMDLQVRRFKRRRWDSIPEHEELGFIAQEAHDDMVRERGSDSEGVDLMSSLAMQVAAFQQFVTETRTEIAELKGQP